MPAKEESTKDQGLTPEEKMLIIDRLSTDPKFSHGVFGCFGQRGHFLKENRGPYSQAIARALRREAAYIQLFEKYDGWFAEEFLARIARMNTDQGECIYVVSFNDRQGDTRGASHTDYALIVPPDESGCLGQSLERDPSVLLEVFRNVYPNYDRSQGELKLDPNHPQITPLSIEIIR